MIIEILDQHGRIKAHHKLTGTRVSVGRGYDNDVILNDPFVCAHHLQMTLDDAGALTVRDLHSVNGLYAQGNKKRRNSLVLRPDESLRIGHTTLRYRTVDHQVAPARQDRLHFGRVNDLLTSPWVQWGSYLALGLLVYLFAYLDTVTEFEPLKPLQDNVLPIAVVVALWAGFWALLSRITLQRFHFATHSIIATSAFLLALLHDDYLSPALRFAFNATLSIDLLALVVSFAILLLAFYGHLRFCSSQSPRRLVGIAAGLAALILVLTHLEDLTGGDDFSSYPDYPSIMMPPAYQLVPDTTLEDFLRQAAELRTPLARHVQDQSGAAFGAKTRNSLE